MSENKVAQYEIVQLSTNWFILEKSILILKLALIVMSICCVYSSFCRDKKYVRIKD